MPWESINGLYVTFKGATNIGPSLKLCTKDFPSTHSWMIAKDFIDTTDAYHYLCYKAA